MSPSMIIKLLLLSIVLLSLFSYVMDIQMNNDIYKSNKNGTDLWKIYKKSFIISAIFRSVAILILFFTMYYA